MNDREISCRRFAFRQVPGLFSKNGLNAVALGYAAKRVADGVFFCYT